MLIRANPSKRLTIQQALRHPFFKKAPKRKHSQLEEEGEEEERKKAKTVDEAEVVVETVLEATVVVGA